MLDCLSNRPVKIQFVDVESIIGPIAVFVECHVTCHTWKFYLHTDRRKISPTTSVVVILSFQLKTEDIHATMSCTVIAKYIERWLGLRTLATAVC